MFSAEAWCHRRGKPAHGFLCWFFCLLCCLAVSIEAQEPDHSESISSPEVWLVTYGPGDIYWQRFGHNGIWIRDPGLGLDHVFNFGFFDFAQEDFLLSFLQGRLMYFSAAQPAQSEFTQYINEDRSIRAQRLDLPADQALALADYLLNEVQPANRDYLYDYYWNNCSTRVRDALDLALDGAIRKQYGHLEAKQNFRDHTRRLTIPDYWLYLGLELGLGSPVDREISRWDEFFIPGVLADGLSQLEKPGSPGQTGVVLEDVLIYSSSVDEPPSQVYSWWPRYLLIPLCLLVLAYLLTRMVPVVSAVGLARVWSLFASMAGLLMLFFWVFTDHEVAQNNLNVLLFNPLWGMVLLGSRFFTVTAWLMIGLGGLALLSAMFLPLQYTADVLAAFLPLNLAAAVVLLGARRAQHRSA